MYDVMLGTGARIGEVLAIRWQDIDGAKVNINGAVKRTKAEGLHRGAPKTFSSAQWVHLPGFAVEAINSRPQIFEMVFPTSTGGLWEGTNFRKRWRKLLAGTEYEGVHPHMVRATVATEIARREGAVAASKQLGHSSVTITEKHYLQRDSSAPDLSLLLEELFGDSI